MATVTYKNQPGIDASNGSVPLAGTRHLYKVKAILWPKEVEEVLQKLLVGKTLHLCCGKSRLGDVLLDSDPDNEPDVVADASNPPFDDLSFDTVLCDPPYNGKFQWNHDLLENMARIAKKRIVFQHWFIPANPGGRYKKKVNFKLVKLYNWQPRTYFGRVQVISVFDREY